MILGEFRRVLDERFRISIPTEFLAENVSEKTPWILAKEQPGALSLWDGEAWRGRFDAAVDLVRAKIQAGRLANRVREVQQLGRLLSTRHRQVQLAGRSRLVIPEGFREFLGVEAGGEVMLVGAALCIELWRFDAWIAHLEQQIPQFGGLLDQLSS